MIYNMLFAGLDLSVLGKKNYARGFESCVSIIMGLRLTPRAVGTPLTRLKFLTFFIERSVIMKERKKVKRTVEETIECHI